ncbi:MAG TPA: hypothetical protein VFV38_28295 [Ktedonobacteraceae bacterium]|nr:hypothetical protein [Ktedonobacteraceae bacterium]
MNDKTAADVKPGDNQEDAFLDGNHLVEFFCHVFCNLAVPAIFLKNIIEELSSQHVSQ